MSSLFSRWAGPWLLALAAALGGCATSGNLKPDETTPSADGGVVVFTVSHARTQEFGRSGANVAFRVFVRAAGAADPTLRAASHEMLSLVTTSRFEAVWGEVYVRALPAGRYEFSGWDVAQHTGVGVRSFAPAQPVPPLVFDVRPGSVVYLGNLHADLLWSRSLGLPLLGGALPEVRDEATRDLGVVLQAYPRLQDRVVAELLPLGRWPRE